LAENILSHFGRRITGITLIPSSNGAFEIETNDGIVLHSKQNAGLFPEDEVLISEIETILSQE